MSAPGGGAWSRLRALDVYRRIPKDLTETTVLGAVLSLASLALIITLFALNLHTMFEGVRAARTERAHTRRCGGGSGWRPRLEATRDVALTFFSARRRGRRAPHPTRPQCTATRASK